MVTQPSNIQFNLSYSINLDNMNGISNNERHVESGVAVMEGKGFDVQIAKPAATGSDSAPLFIQSNHLFGADFPYHVSHDVIADYFPLHRHDFIEMNLILSGRGTEKINGVAHDLMPGVLSVLFPWHAHELRADNDAPLNIFKCSFGMQVFVGGNSRPGEMGSTLIADLNASPHHYFNPQEQARLQGIFEQLLEEYKGSSLWKEDMLWAGMMEALILFDRGRKSDKAVEAGERPVNDTNVWAIIDLIHLRYMENITLEELSGLFHYSASHINKLLKQHTGLTFDSLLTEIRVRNASGLLRFTDIQVSELAKLLGYSSQESFSRAFKNMKGLSPENYRKNNRSSDNWGRRPAYPSPIDSRIIYYIHLNYHEDIALSTLARHFHYNENYLSDLFNVQTGQGFTDFLHEVRVFHACSLLATTERAVNDIGFDVGFNSTETFLRAFKKLKGMTPGEFRRSIAAQE